MNDDTTRARSWLTQHGLSDVDPTPAFAARLEVRRRAGLGQSVLLAALIIAAALAQAENMFVQDGGGPVPCPSPIRPCGTPPSRW